MSFLRSALAAVATMVLASLEGQAASVKTNVLVPLEANLAILPEIVPVGNSLLFMGSVIGRKGIHLYRVEPGDAPIQIAELGKHGFCFDEERQAVQFTGHDQRRVVVSTKTWQPVDLEPRPFPYSQQECNVRLTLILTKPPRTHEMSGTLGLRIQFVDTEGAYSMRILDMETQNVKSDIPFDWRMKGLGSVNVGLHSYRRIYLPEGKGFILFPSLARFERINIWQRDNLLKIPLIYKDGTYSFLSVPWSPIFLQNFIGAAQTRVGLIASIEADPKDPDKQLAGIWVLREERYSQVYRGQLQARSLVVSRDGCTAYFLGAPDGTTWPLSDPKMVVSLGFCG